jgi:hypothetical protein
VVIIQKIMHWEELNVLTKEELEKPRTPTEFDNYFWDVYRNATPEEKTAGWLKKGLWKEIFEEVTVLKDYCKWKFPNNDVTINYKVGNQGYDAIIRNETYEEYVEITFPHIGKKAKQEAKRVIKNGYSSACYDLDDALGEIMQCFIDTANKKSLKDYNYHNSSLIFALNTFGLPWYKIGYDNTIELFVKQLQKIVFKTKSVYIVLLNSKDIDNKVIDVSRD